MNTNNSNNLNKIFVAVILKQINNKEKNQKELLSQNSLKTLIKI